MYNVEGWNFYIVTNLKPLVYSLFSNTNRYSSRQVRHLDFISQYTSDISYVSGRDNLVVDALTGVDIRAIQTMVVTQVSDPEL